MAWIDIMNTDSEKPEVQGFNWATEQEKLKRKRSAAQLLKDQAMQNQQGQYVKHGDYIGFTGGNTLASTAARLLSAYMGSKSDKAADAYASEIDKTSDAAFMEQASKLDALLNPKPEPTASTQGLGTVSQQPTTPQPEPAQSFPVREQPAMEARPLEPAPPQAPVGAGAGRGFVVEPPGARAAAAAMPPANGGQRRGGTPNEMRRNAYVAGGGEPAPAFQGNGATGSWDAPPPPPPAAPKVAAQAINPPAPAAPQQAAPQPSGLMPDMTPRAAPPAPAAQPAPSAPAAPKVSQAEVLGQLHAIAKTGPMGQQFASAQLQQVFGPKANGFEFKAVKQGDNEVLVAVHPRTGATQVVWQGGGGQPSVAQQRENREAEEARQKLAEKNRGRTEAVAMNDYALRKIDELLPKAGDATGMGGKFNNWFNSVTGIPTDAAVATEELNSVKGTLLAAAMRMTKEQSGTAAGLSQVESEALQKSIASLDPRIGKEALERQLNEVRRLFRQYGERMSSDTPASGSGEAPAAFKVPPRGTRITSPEDLGL